jgi:hypothetical protein
MASHFMLVIGTTDLLKYATQHKLFVIKQRLVHPKYNSSNFDNDIALLELGSAD